MNSAWPMVRLGEVLERATETVTVQPDTEYREVTVKLWGKGVVLRGVATGAAIAGARRFVARSGQLILSRIDARNGASGIVPHQLDGAVVTNDFPLFNLDARRIDPAFLGWLTRTSGFVGLCKQASEGTTNRVRLKEERFLALEVPLPSLPEQRRLVARIDQLATRMDEAISLRRTSTEEIQALAGTFLNQLFGNPDAATAGRARIRTWSRLSAVVDDVADGPHVTPSYVEAGIPFITALNITSGRIRFANHKFITSEDHRGYQKRARAERGDVLITKDGTIGVPCFVDTDREFSFFVSVALVKPKRDVLDGEFLTWALRTPYLQERITMRSRGDMIRHLVLREIRDLIVPVPQLPDQRRIVAELDALEAEVDAVRRLQSETAEELDALLPAVLDRAFRGEL